MLGRLRRNDAQPLQLVLRGLARLLGHLRVFDLLAQLLNLARARVPFAQLLLDRPHLLAQVELLLILVQFALHLGLDLVPKFD